MNTESMAGDNRARQQMTPDHGNGNGQTVTLRDSVEQALENYFSPARRRPGHGCLSAGAVRGGSPLLEKVMEYTSDNQTRASTMLGLNREHCAEAQAVRPALDPHPSPRFHWNPNRSTMSHQDPQPPIRRALISVSDKSGIVEFAQALQQQGVEILPPAAPSAFSIATTSRLPKSRSTPASPEIMAGRVKTLHPTIHGGILGRHGTDDDVMAEHGIAPIDMVVVNLYPSRKP